MRLSIHWYDIAGLLGVLDPHRLTAAAASGQGEHTAADEHALEKPAPRPGGHLASPFATGRASISAASHQRIGRTNENGMLIGTGIGIDPVWWTP